MDTDMETSYEHAVASALTTAIFKEPAIVPLVTIV
jgi:hypothetical protein